MTCEHPCCDAKTQDVLPFALAVFHYGVMHIALCRLHRMQLLLTCGVSRDGVGV